LVTPNPSSGVFYGQATIDGTPAEEGDWSAAFDEDGNIAGAAVIMINAGTAYINMPIYGDDTTTPDVDEGMNAGESFVLRIWDSSTGDILEYQESFDCWYNNNGAPMNECGDYTEVYDFPGSTGGGNDNSETNPFEDLVTPNPSSGVFLAQATIDGTPAGGGDWTAAFDEDGNIAGAAEIMINAGTAYINMPIYGDDTTTPDIDEGINVDESFTLRFGILPRVIFLNIQRVLINGLMRMVVSCQHTAGKRYTTLLPAAVVMRTQLFQMKTILVI